MRRARSALDIRTFPDIARLQRRDDGRMLELRHVHLWQHSGLGVDIKNLLDGREIRRRNGVSAEIIVLEQIRIQNRDRRFHHLGDDLERLLPIRERLLHARRDVTDIGLHDIRILVDEIGAACIKEMDDIRNFLR